MPDNEIPFTQYLRPNGERRPESIEVAPEIYHKADAIIKAGFRFECEILMNGYVHLTVSDDEDDYAREVVPNGPQVPQAVDRLVIRFYNRLQAVPHPLPENDRDRQS
jgi:hypothetical protein